MGVAMDIVKYFKPLGEGLSKGLHVLPSLRPKIGRSIIIRGTVLSMILILASGLRLLPLRWGFYLNEFDPYFHYYTAKYISSNGISSIFSWHDWRGWWPYGRDMRFYSNFGLTLTAVALYRILNILGIPLTLSIGLNPLDPLSLDPLYNLCVIFPIIASALTCIAIYLLGRDLGGETVGLLSALLLALDPSHISRTSLGWFDDETIGILSALLLILFFSRALNGNRSMKSSVAYSLLAGLSLGYLCISWGAARYLIDIIALFALILLFLKRYSQRLLLLYTLTFAIAFLIAVSSPRVGFGFLFETFNLPVYGVFILLLMNEAFSRGKTLKIKVIYVSIIILALIVFLSSLMVLGLIRDPGRKFIYAIFPSLRSESALFESVAEHKPSSWATFYHNFGVGLMFVPVGVFFAASAVTNLSILIILYCLTSMYFASSMVRLIILTSPAICLLWALALKRVSSPLILSVKEAAKLLRRRAKFKPIEKELIAGVLILFFALFTLTYVFGSSLILGSKPLGPRVLSYADTPATISGASLSLRPTSTVRDWIDALIWMRESLPPSPSKPGENGTVVACWWDYGYWITVFANKTTLADNGTFNGTQIQQIGKMFMSNETEAVNILRRYNVTHVVVYVTFSIEIAGAAPEYALLYGGGLGGDNGKWQWMARIPGLNDSAFGSITIGWDWIDYNGNQQLDYGELVDNDLGQNTVLYKLMMYGLETVARGYSTINLEHFKKAYFSREYPLSSLQETYNVAPLVCIYEVIYD